jgi:hypothetical protein
VACTAAAQPFKCTLPGETHIYFGLFTSLSSIMETFYSWNTLDNYAYLPYDCTYICLYKYTDIYIVSCAMGCCAMGCCALLCYLMGVLPWLFSKAYGIIKYVLHMVPWRTRTFKLGTVWGSCCTIFAGWEFLVHNGILSNIYIKKYHIWYFTCCALLCSMLNLLCVVSICLT